MIIAIDGPAGTGKSTIASLIAKKLGITYLNSGSFYRALTYALNNSDIDINDENAVIEFCKKQKIEYKNSRLILNDADIEDSLHNDDVSAKVAQVSSNIQVRHFVNGVMRKITENLDIVCEGRDMTTVVFPNAEYKFYLDATIDVQAKRRFDQGVSNLSLEEIKQAIIKRDEIDKNKKEGALTIAPDAIYINTSALTIDNVCEIILSKIHDIGFVMEEQMEVEMDVSESQAETGAIRTQLEESLKSLKALEDGQLIKGTVVAVSDDLVFVDIGYKSEGKVPVAEFEGKIPAVGDVLSIVLLHKDGRGGPEISYTKAKARQLWKDLRKANDDKTAVEGKIEKEVKGGFDVNLGGEIHAFLPISQSDSQKVDDPKKLLGITSNFYIERLFSEGKANIVVNRRKYLEEQINKNRDEFFEKTQIGDTVKGFVKSFTSFGAFIDLGGFDGLLHINDMSWGHVTRPKDFVKKGQEVELKVIRLDSAERRINLSLKHFTEDPWVHFEEKYHVDDIVDGTVTKLTEFGAFIELEEGIEGLAHVSEFSWTRKINKPSDMVKIGDKLKCMILGYDIQAGRVSLGLKQTVENPWNTIEQRHPVGSIVQGKVVKITPGGAFVQIDDGIDGFLRAEDISWTKKVKHPGSELSVDKDIDVKILDINTEHRRISVGIKQITEDPWKKFAEEYKPGSTLEGEITSITDFGIFVRAPGEGKIEGLVNKLNLSEDRNIPYEEAVKKYKVGDKVNVFVVDVNVEKEKVGFSVKEFKKAQSRKEILQYMTSSENGDDSAYTLGDALKGKSNK